MDPRIAALSVHLFTASGAVFAMLSMLAAANHQWSLMFLWLVVAFAVDGIDGPLARRFDVKNYAPRFDGVLLDLIIDYLTYVFIPAFALFQSGLLPGWTGWVTIITKDNSFHGFPGCWNMVALVMFAIQPNFWIILSLVTTLAIAMFLPLKFIHPVRTERWRHASLPITLLWISFAGWSAWVDFSSDPIILWGLTITSLYLISAGLFQQLISKR